MIVTRSAMDEYTAEVNVVSEEAAQVAMDAYDEMRKANLNASRPRRRGKRRKGDRRR